MPFGAIDAVHRTGQFNNQVEQKAVRQKKGSLVPVNDWRLRTPFDVVIALLIITNAASARPTSFRSESDATAPSSQNPRAVNCPPETPTNLSGVLHEIGEVLRHPVSGAESIGETWVYRVLRHGCPPSRSKLKEAALAAGDVAATVAEAEIDPQAPWLIQLLGLGFEVAGDIVAKERVSPKLMGDAVLSSGGGLRAEPLPASWGPSSIEIFSPAVHAIRQQPALDLEQIQLQPADESGVHHYLDSRNGEIGRAVQVDGAYYPVTELSSDSAVIGGIPLIRQDGRFRLRVDSAAEGSESEPAVAARCRRAPGSVCHRSPYSPELTSVLRQHLRHGVTEAQAQHRGFTADPQRPGWYWHMRGERLHGYLRLEDRYFPVKTHRYGRCERMTVHLPRAARVPERTGAGSALIDIAESPLTTGPHTLTQAELNAHRGLPSRTASDVYEHAVRHLPHVHLHQLEQAALVNYYGAGEVRLNDFLQQDPVPPHQRQDLDREVQTLQQALARIPAYPGRVYRGTVMSETLFSSLHVGQTVYLRSFVRASGDRSVALQELAGRPLHAAQMHVVLELDMRRSAHPTGLHTLRDEAEVMIEDGRVYVVDAVRPGELCLREAGVTRQALGQGGATVLLLS
ncbi:hypothetical protein [Stenotrophomonas sp.]|uniref:hypothetical protein n=1 Tax=Stenotrophomonas sp. TaxID=69392 RepID=UPI002896F99A|nr:hypothetical protein [Stenotrophomonas sp.]